MQHLLFPDRLAGRPTSSLDVMATSSAPSPSLRIALKMLSESQLSLYSTISELPAPTAEDNDTALELYELLRCIDPDTASRWHWRDVRKVLRSLIIMKEQNKLNSEIIAQQNVVDIEPRWVPLLVISLRCH
jgi:tRNA dimethylallyltransferase